VDTKAHKSGRLSDFRIKSTLGVALMGFVMLTPFAINNFLQGRYLLGAGSLVVVGFCAANAWNCVRNSYNSSLIFWGLVPAITLFLVLALREQGVVVTYWCFPALLAFYFMLPERLAWVANAVFLGVIFPQAWVILENPFMIRFVVTALAVSLFSAMFVHIIADQQKLLEKQAVTDPLTGLFNRMLLGDTLDQAIQQNDRAGVQMTLVALDLDHFKSVNDQLGHAGGDKVLRGVGDFLRQRMRRADKVFRIGGEEFLILLFDTGAEEGRRVADEICSGFSSLPLLPDRPVTVSIGVATLRKGEDGEEWMKRCDQKLYQAKSEGRNLVVS
jgi:diguanylate cyclase (GGDEF)-like protein